MDNLTKSQISLYWINPGEKLMYRIVSQTEVYLIQVKGRDLNKSFTHRHEKVTFPDYERLDADLNSMEASTQQAWELLMNEYLAVNNLKREMMSEYRQKVYNNGGLLL